MEFSGKKSVITPEGVFIIGTYDENGVPNAMNAAWDETGILIGTIVSSQVDDSILTDGKVDLEKMQPIMFDISSGTYRSIGPVVGKAYHDGLQLK